MELKELKNCVTTNLNFELLYILIFRILKFFLSKKNRQIEVRSA